MVNSNFYNQNIQEIKLSELADKFSVELSGPDSTVNGVANISAAAKGELCFLTNIAYIRNLENTNASACIIEADFLDRAKEVNDKISYLFGKNAYNVLGKILELFYSEKTINSGISGDAVIATSVKLGKDVTVGPNTVISDNVEIGDNVVIYPGVFIANGVKIGDNSIIGANCSISYATIGKHVEILQGTQIGQDGFGFSLDGASFSKVIQLGEVIIGDHVSIGSNVSIDRGSLENTVIGEGTKIDNLVQIAHNVKIGKHCLLTSQVGVAGSTVVGDYCVFGGQVGVSGHLKIGSYNRFAAQAGVTKNIPDNSGDLYGMPARAKKTWQKEQIALKNIAKDLFNNK